MIVFIDLKKQYAALRDDIQTEIMKVLNEGQYIHGPQVAELEAALAEYVGVKHVVACGNGTSSLELALMALNVGPGQAVFCPAFTFMATAEVVALRGARPVFVDIDPRTYNLDPADLRIKIDAVRREGKFEPRGIIPVDLFGLPADYDALEPLAAEHGLFILEDAAQGFGGARRGRRAGAFGRMGSFSFFPAKPLGGYGDGGALTTDDDGLAGLFRSLRTHGSGGHKYEHLRLGANSRLDTLQAAILLAKLRAFPGELEERQRVAGLYTRLLAGHVPVPVVPEGSLSSWAQYTVRVPAGERDRIMAELKAVGIPTMIYYPRPLHLQPAFAYLGGRAGDLPASETAAGEVLSLPMHPYLEDVEAEKIAATLTASLERRARA